MQPHSERVFYHEQYKDTLFVILSGPSAGGKTTISKQLGQWENFTLLIKYTDRPVRPGEQDRVDYFFVAPEAFDTHLTGSNCLAWVERYTHHYALPVAEVARAVSSGTIPLFILDPNAAVEFRKVYPNSILVFVGPDDTREVYRRIISRADSEQEKQFRIEQLEEEYRLRREFDITYNNTNENELYCVIAKMLEKRRGLL